MGLVLGAGLVGLATSVAFVYITQYYTAGTCRPVQEIAEASKTGPATNIISGIAVGFETTAVTAITISIALFVATASASRRSPASRCEPTSAASSAPRLRRWAC